MAESETKNENVCNCKKVFEHKKTKLRKKKISEIRKAFFGVFEVLIF